jgi:hypothetical protein
MTRMVLDADKSQKEQVKKEPCNCQGPLPPDVIKGLELFNAGQYFEAHEELEKAWRAEKGPIRELYRGILQVGVGYYHIQRSNVRGALKMFRRCRQWLDRFPDECCGIDLKRLRQDYQRVERLLQEVAPFDPSSLDLQPVHYRMTANGKSPSVSK